MRLRGGLSHWRQKGVFSDKITNLFNILFNTISIIIALMSIYGVLDESYNIGWGTKKSLIVAKLNELRVN